MKNLELFPNLDTLRYLTFHDFPRSDTSRRSLVVILFIEFSNAKFVKIHFLFIFTKIINNNDICTVIAGESVDVNGCVNRSGIHSQFDICQRVPICRNYTHLHVP